jgi:putative sigma-54 modulation protein
MRIEVTGKGVELTDAIAAYADKKCQKLTKFYNGVMEIEVVLDKPGHNQVSAEIVVDVVKHDSFVTSAAGENIYACIDEAAEKMYRRLHDFKEKLRDVKR